MSEKGDVMAKGELIWIDVAQEWLSLVDDRTEFGRHAIGRCLEVDYPFALQMLKQAAKIARNYRPGAAHKFIAKLNEGPQETCKKEFEGKP